MNIRDQIYYSENGDPSFIFCVFDSVRLISKTSSIFAQFCSQSAPKRKQEDEYIPLASSPEPHPQRIHSDGAIWSNEHEEEEEDEEVNVVSKKRRVGEKGEEYFRTMGQADAVSEDGTSVHDWKLAPAEPDALALLFPNTSNEVLWDDADNRNSCAQKEDDELGRAQL